MLSSWSKLQIFATDCAEFNRTWTNMVADMDFPVAEGTVISLSCEDGYQLIGDRTVTCSQEAETLFEYSSEPRCGKYFESFC